MSRACEPHQLAIMSPATTVDIVRHVCKSFGLLAIKTWGLGPLPLSLGGTLWVTWQTECSKVILFRKGPSASADLSQEPQSNGTSQVEIVVKNPAINAEDVRDMGLIPGLGRLPGEGHGNLIQYSCLEKVHAHIRRFRSSEANMWGGHSERLKRKILTSEELALFGSQLVKS